MGQGPVLPKRPNPFMEALPESVRGLVETFFPSDELPLDSVAAPLMTIGRGIGRGVQGLRSLPMDEASRMGRAAEQGFTNPMYHGTRTAQDFSEFRGPVAGASPAASHKFPVMEGDYGIHATPRAETAGRFTGETEYPGFMSTHGRVMPLQVRMDQTLNMPDMKNWSSPHDWVESLGLGQGGGRYSSTPISSVLEYETNDPATLQNLYDIAREGASRSRSGMRAIDDSVRFQQDITDYLTKAGYDSIRYKNLIEGVGEPSYLLLDPRKIRSRFATFDPARVGSRDIMAGLAGAGVAGTLAGRDK